jgi:hypothetical protein
MKHVPCFDAQSSLKIAVEDLSVMLCQMGESSNHAKVLGYLYLQGRAIQECKGAVIFQNLGNFLSIDTSQQPSILEPRLAQL